MRRNEIADLTAFIEVAEHLSFRAAALKLGGHTFGAQSHDAAAGVCNVACIHLGENAAVRLCR